MTNKFWIFPYGLISNVPLSVESKIFCNFWSNLLALVLQCKDRYVSGYPNSADQSFTLVHFLVRTWAYSDSDCSLEFGKITNFLSQGHCEAGPLPENILYFSFHFFLLICFWFVFKFFFLFSVPFIYLLYFSVCHKSKLNKLGSKYSFFVLTP